jgi:DNA-binding NtrC family response regulator
MTTGAEALNPATRPVAVVTALVVEPNLPDAQSIIATLTSRCLQVTIAETFAKAKERIAARPPDVIVTAVRLAEYNGLHLVLRARSARHDLAAIVMSDAPDPVLEAHADAMGAIFMIKPISEAELSAAVFRALFMRSSAASTSHVLRAPFERRVAERRSIRETAELERRLADRRRDLPSLLRLVASANPGRTAGLD